MKLVEGLIDSISTKLIRKYTYDFASDPLNVSHQYQKHLDSIKKAYDEAYYWHGTGRYHYRHEGSSKYDSRFTEKTFDVLRSLIAQGGLMPQYDFWTKLTSISVSKNRIYARAYAQFHQFENDPLRYEFGTPTFWFYVLGMKQFFTGRVIHNFIRVYAKRKEKEFNDKFKQWMGYVRKDGKKSLITFLSFHRLRSDIPGNYGLLFGIKKSAVEEVHYNSTIERFESRTQRPILFKDMTHLEVPLAHFEETKKLLEKNNLKLPVLPLELGELYSSTLKFSSVAS